MPLALPLVNGRRFDFSSVEVKTNGASIVGRAVSSINYSDTLEPGVVRGGSPLPLGLTRGEYTAEASMEMPKEESVLFLAALVAQATGAAALLGATGSAIPQGYMEVRFEIDVAYAESMLAAAIQVDHLNGCRIKSVSDSHARGADGLMVRLDMFVQYIVRNGLMPMGVDVMVK